MDDALYQRLDAARERRYPKSSTVSFAMWLLSAALAEYEAQERDASRTVQALAPTRLVDRPPQNQIIVRE